MFQVIAIASALFGGGFLAKKLLQRRSPGVAITSTPIDEFLEQRSDGLYQFNRSTAVSILGWLGSVSLVPVDGEEGLYDLATSADGSPRTRSSSGGRSRTAATSTTSS